jgi:hypothetical protein
MVDVLDGFLTMWEAAHHLQALEALDVVEPVSDAGEGRRGPLDIPFRLREREAGSGG